MAIGGGGLVGACRGVEVTGSGDVQATSSVQPIPASPRNARAGIAYFPPGARVRSKTARCAGRARDPPGGYTIVVTSPAGLEDFFAEVGIAATDPATPPVVSGLPDMERMAAIARKYELEITGPPVR
ncbi:MAG TPA: hypothetical protein VKY74_20720 [Chloroflexia bacterium]|nr:hypothetical protein [Chloroflexia bacterium]